MELSHKTTVLFDPELFEHLRRVARERGTSVGQLIREACAERYRFVPPEDRRAAVERLAALRLPVGDVEELIAESVPAPEELLP